MVGYFICGRRRNFRNINGTSIVEEPLSSFLAVFFLFPLCSAPSVIIGDLSYAVFLFSKDLVLSSPHCIGKPCLCTKDSSNEINDVS